MFGFSPEVIPLLTKLAMMLSTATLGMCSPVVTYNTVETRTCPQYEALLEAYNPGWDVNRMSRIMWRESNCQPHVRSRTKDTGLLQINDINHDYLTRRHIDVTNLTNPTVNVLAAAELYKYWQRATGNGYQPWNATT